MLHKSNLVLFIIFLFILAAAGCSTSSVARTPGDSAEFGALTGLGSNELARESQIDFPYHCGNYVIKPLYGGQTIFVGWVAVWNDEDNMYIHYRTTGGWKLAETHAAVATYLGGIPHTNSGNPKVGHFPYKAEHDPTVVDYEYTIPLEWAPGTMLYLAAHSVVYLYDGDMQVVQEETAWARGCFPCIDIGSWASFFTYNIQSCPEE